MTSSSDPLWLEIELAKKTAFASMKAYENFGLSIKDGPIHNTYYSELTEFLNLRMESVKSSLLLLEQTHVGDALLLCRPLIEHALLFKLMCRGHLYFKIQNFKTSKEASAALSAAKGKLKNGNVQYLRVQRHPSRSKAIIYIFEGLHSSPNDELTIPLYFFLYQNYNPSSHKLKIWKYFSPITVNRELKKAFQNHKLEAMDANQNYLSFRALLDGLKVNKLISDGTEDRIQAHFTFLGNFVHPTNRAQRELCERNNVFENRTGIGLGKPYSPVAILLSYLYLLFIIREYLVDLITVYESAPSKYQKKFDANPMKSLCDKIEKEFSYFWFIGDKAPDYDKFRVACKRRPTKKPNFRNISDGAVQFDHNIYARLQNALIGWSNVGWGDYDSPLRRWD